MIRRSGKPSCSALNCTMYTVHCTTHSTSTIYLQRRMRSGVNFDQRSIETWTSQKRQLTSNIIYLYPTSLTCHPDISYKYYQIQSTGSRGLNTLCSVLWHMQYCSTFCMYVNVYVWFFKQNIHIKMHAQTWLHPPMTFICMHTWRTFKFKCMRMNS